MADLEEVWNLTLEKIRQELSQPSFDTWLKPTYPVSLLNSTLTIGVPNEFARDWLNTRYASLIRETVQSITQKPVQLQFIIEANSNKEKADPVNNNSRASRPVSASRRTTPAERFSSQPLNSKYTFDTFVVGNNNRFAHAASLAVAEAPARAYNPLFVYGGVGLGKTHLMQAIGHYVIDKQQDHQVLYVTSELFTNQLINAIRDDSTVDFRNQYRSVDVLLIDDIQFLAGKERTQEEFFHTFNTLHESSRQIIISSDRPPKDIPTLEERLRSRFEWGLITDIQLPDLETRAAILRKKAHLDQLAVSDDVIMHIASRVETNIRELEGALNRVMAYATVNEQEIDIELAQAALKDIIPEIKPRLLNITTIQETVASHFHLRPEDLKSKKRNRQISLPRQVAMFLCRELTDASLPRIGEEFGGRDHTTVLHANEKIRSQVEKDPELQGKIQELTQSLLGS